MTQLLPEESANHTAQLWQSHHAYKGLQWPDEQVVRFLAIYTKSDQRSSLSAIDIGCGLGRHISLLRNMNFGRIAGTDIDPESVKSVKAMLGSDCADIRNEDLRNLSFPARSFDVALCWGVAMYRRTEQLIIDLTNLRRIMRKGGVALVNFRSKDNWFFGLGEELEPKTTFLLDNRSGDYSGMVYCFMDQEQSEDLVTTSGFDIITQEKLMFYKGGNRVKNGKCHSWWIYSLRAI